MQKYGAIYHRLLSVSLPAFYRDVYAIVLMIKASEYRSSPVIASLQTNLDNHRQCSPAYIPNDSSYMIKYVYVYTSMGRAIYFVKRRILARNRFSYQRAVVFFLHRFCFAADMFASQSSLVLFVISFSLSVL